jgi:hypothetical protein
MAFRGFPIQKSTGDHALIALKRGLTLSGLLRVGCVTAILQAPKVRTGLACPWRGNTVPRSDDLTSQRRPQR